MIRIALLTLAFASSAVMAAGKSYKMYPQPFAKPNTLCDVYTSLQIDQGKDGITATLVDSLSGACELFVQPNPRTYIAQVDQANDGCGTTTYLARDSRTGRPLFKLVDNRRRECQNVVPGLLVATEYDESGNENTLYSKDN